MDRSILAKIVEIARVRDPRASEAPSLQLAELDKAIAKAEYQYDRIVENFMIDMD